MLQWIARYVNVDSCIVFHIIFYYVHVNSDEVIFPKGFLTKLPHHCSILLSIVVFFFNALPLFILIFPGK